jgi:hypothetical protein
MVLPPGSGELAFDGRDFRIAGFVDRGWDPPFDHLNPAVCRVVTLKTLRRL